MANAVRRSAGSDRRMGLTEMSWALAIKPGVGTRFCGTIVGNVNAILLLLTYWEGDQVEIRLPMRQKCVLVHACSEKLIGASVDGRLLHTFEQLPLLQYHFGVRILLD